MTSGGFSQTSAAEQALLGPDRKKWPRWPLVALVLAAAVLALVLWFGIGELQDEPRGSLDPAVGTKLTFFHLEPLTGDSGTVIESDLAGHITLVNFWGPWCGACAVEFPHLVELEQHFRSRSGFQFFSVSSDPAGEDGLRENTEEFLKRHRADFPAYRDPRGQTHAKLAEAAKIERLGYPVTILLSPDATILAMWHGYSPGDEDDLRQTLERSLATPSDSPKKPSAAGID
jgi:thiol-disulfide isomerase/thioredoxin